MTIGLMALRAALFGPTREPLRIVSRNNLPPGPLTFLDVRPEDEYRFRHLEGAYSVGSPTCRMELFLDAQRHRTLVIYEAPGRFGRARKLALQMHEKRGDTIFVMADPELL